MGNVWYAKANVRPSRSGRGRGGGRGGGPFSILLHFTQFSHSVVCMNLMLHAMPLSPSTPSALVTQLRLHYRLIYSLRYETFDL